MKRTAYVSTTAALGFGVALAVMGSLAFAEMATTQPKEKKAPHVRITGEYAKITVTDEQAAKIAKIQKEAKEKMDAISDEADKSIEALLTDEQKKQLADTRAAAKEHEREMREKNKAVKSAEKTAVNTTQPSDKK